ncbi:MULTISPECIES: hypothetical protein [Lysobacter]|uniref:Uncharacterized protein n=1 Tax=Lysobacter firmicutimachus TaxID=1792846 RepID=A0ABU8CZW3_9GAMM|nr:hypothetical protein [Lysobacter antibioticus]
MAANDPGVAASVEAVEAAERIHQAQMRANPKPPVKKIPRRNAVAPAVSVEQLRTKLLRLVSSLHAPLDTEAAHVGSVFNIDFVPELLAIREGDAVGELRDLGSYWVSVIGLYKGAPGKSVEVTFGPKRVPGQRSTRCTFDFKPFADELAAMGYSMGKSGVRHLERWGFVRPSTSAGTSIYVGVHLYRVDDGSEEGRACVSSVDVNVDRSQG